MALFSRIFQSRRNSDGIGSGWRSSDNDKKWIPPAFDKSLVRLVIFRDHDRSVFFDSKAVHRVEPPEQPEPRKNLRFPVALHRMTQRGPPPEAAAPKQPPKYTLSRPGSDVKMLGEMVFGAAPMVYKESTLKVHSIRSPHQLMVTRVFVPNRMNRESSCDSEPMDSYSVQTPSSGKMSRNSSSNDIAHSIPMDVPNSPRQGSSIENEQDSGLSNSVTSTSSMATSFPSPSSSVSSFTSSYNSLHRRWRRSQATSLEHNLIKRSSDEGMCEPMPAKKLPKYGVAILFNLPEDKDENAKQFQNFFFSHITLVDSHVNKLWIGIEKAMMNRKTFVHFAVEALDTFRDSICDLYTSPRLLEPVWLNMMCFTTQRVSLCHRFLKELMLSVDKYDTKNTKFFLSTLITAVLTNHLAWVPTVTPAGATPSRTYLDKHSAKWLDTLAKSHPYNPLWAQLGDLYGAIGFPLRLCRTVVAGKRSDVVGRILYILSYFIRCSEVLETPGSCDHVEDDEDEDGEDEDLLSTTWDSDLAARAEMWAGPRRHSSGSTLHSPSLLRSNIRQNSHDGKKAVFSFDDMAIGRHSDTHAGDDSFGGCFPLHDDGDPGGGYFPSQPSFVCYLEENCGARHEDMSFVCYLEQDAPSLERQDSQCSHEHCKAENTLQYLSSSKHKHSTLETLSASSYSVSRWLSDNADCAAVDREIDSADTSTLETTCDNKNSHEANHGTCKCDNSHHADGDSTVCKSRLMSADTSSSLVKNNINPCEPTLPLNCADVEVPVPIGSEREPSPETAINMSVQLRDQSLDSGICDSFGSELSNNEATCVRDKHTIPDVIQEESQSDLAQGSASTSPHHSSGCSPPTEAGNVAAKRIGQIEDSSQVFEAFMAGDSNCVVDCDDVAGATGGAGDAPCGSGTSQPASSFCHTKRSDLLRKDSRDSGHVSCETRSTATMDYANVDCVDYNDNTDFIPDQMLAAVQQQASTPVSTSEPNAPTLTTSVDSESLSLGSVRTAGGNEGLGVDCDKDDTGSQHSKVTPELVGAVKSLRSEDKMSSSLASQATVTDDTEGAESSSEHVKAERPTTLTLGRVKRPSGPRWEGDRQRHLSRQSSNASTFNPGRCRSVTPTELGRRRHASAMSGTSSTDMTDFWQNLKEVPMPSCAEHDAQQDYHIQKFDRNFGRSLLAGYSDHYLSDFVVHGTGDEAYLGKLHNDLKVAVKNSVLDEPISEAACIVADTDKWSVKKVSCHNSQSDRIQCAEISPSQLIVSIIESVHDLWKLKMSPEFCLMHLEDRLQEIYFRSKIVADFIRLHKKADPIEITETFNVDVSDLPLLYAVMGTHTPHMALSFV